MNKYSLTELSAKSVNQLRDILRREFRVGLKRTRGLSKMELIEMVCDRQDAAGQTSPSGQPAGQNINSLQAFHQAGLKKGDLCRLDLVNSHHYDAAVFLGAYHAHYGQAQIIGLTFLIGNQSIDLEWESIVECRKV